VGLLDVAILDKHILRLMHHYKLIEDMPKGWTRLAMKRMNNYLFPLCRSFTWI